MTTRALAGLFSACTGDAPDTDADAVNFLRWDLSVQQIRELTAQLIEQTKRVYDEVGAQHREDVSYESTLKALADVEVAYTGNARSCVHGCVCVCLCV